MIHHIVETLLFCLAVAHYTVVSYNTLQNSEWADYAAVQAYCGNLSGNKLTCTRNLPGNIRPQSSATVISKQTTTTTKGGRGGGRGMNGLTFSQNLRKRGKS